MYELKPIQKEAANTIHADLFTHNKNKVLASIATGWGKTILAAKMCQLYISRGKRCLFLANRAELIFQTVDKFKKAADINADIEKAEKRAPLNSNCVVASCQTMAKPDRLSRWSSDHFDFIIIDEAHGALCDQYQIILDHFDSKYLFLTATADKLVDANLYEIVDKVSYEFSLTESVKSGYNVKPIVRPIFLDKALLKMLDTGEDDEHLLDKVMPSVIEEIQSQCQDRKTIIFLSNVERSKRTAEQLKDAGLNALHCDGYMGNAQRREVLNKFNSFGPGSIICNPALLGTGYDQPDIDCVIVLRNVASRALYAQMVGRALRVSPGKNHGLILDFLGLTQKHNITASIKDLEKIKRVFQNFEAGKEIDLIESDSNAIRDAEKSVALKLLEQTEKENYKRLVSIAQMKKLFNIKTGFGEIPLSRILCDQLNAKGVSMRGLKTNEEALGILQLLAGRDANNKATPKQVRTLISQRYNDAKHYTKNQARDLLIQLKDNGFRRQW
jgi:superfamily II DNA or RNA helicase